jgi:primary-amine oxidase
MKSPTRTWLLLPLACLLVGGAGVLMLFGVRGQRPPAPEPAADVPWHPLDPLTADEIKRAASILRDAQHLPSEVLFSTLVLNEPAKELVLADKPSPREAFAVVYDHKANETHEAVVDLAAGQVKSWKHVPGAQPNIALEEFEIVQDFVRADPDVQAHLRRRGLSDPKKVVVELWATGARAKPGEPSGPRLGRAIFYDNRDGVNSYVHPIGGLMAIVNLNTRKVVRIVDAEIVPTSENRDNVFVPGQLGANRTAPRPLVHDQPQGPTFSLHGNEVRWQNWSFRFGNHPREALVLYQVGYEDQGRVRPILYRGSLAELVVPYGEAGELWDWRAPFDEGEYGLGVLLGPLTPGKQVPGYATLLPSVVPDGRGTSRVIPGSIALYERDGGVLWQHTDPETLKQECRRARELVVTCEVVAGNYDYGISWIFGQDGTLRGEVELGGIPLAKAARTVKCQRCAGAGQAEDGNGEVMAPHIVAPNHQHWFCFRLDLDVDGTANTVSEWSVRPAANPKSAAFTAEERVLRTEKEAQCDLNLAGQHRWRVFNPTARTALGHYPGYVLEPGENSVPLQAADSAVRQRAAFINHHLWVTRYKPEERYPAGDYPNGSSGGEGLPKYVADDEKLEGQDVVLWYSCGVTHVPRPEDWPVMPSARVGFRLTPHGFFTRNPALDMP